jgi:excinuclease ABC subunit B
MLQPLFVTERPQGDIGKPFQLSSEFRPAGDQPQAIDELCEGLARGEKDQVLLGVTGSGKTFTMAHVIQRLQRPAIVLAPNKTLAAQLYGEMKSFFPENAVEYFVSYYDYYQPEAYVPRSDTYVEKESSLNEQIDRMRHSATRAILERRDVVVVASVSCIYGIGSVETYSQMTESVQIGERVNRNRLLAHFVEMQYRRNDTNFVRGTFRVRGDTIEIFPAHYEDRAWRVSLFGDEVEGIHEIDPLTGEKITALQSIKIYANSHYVTPRPTLLQAIEQIKRDLKIRLDELHSAGRLLEAQRLEQRTTYDVEMIEATGSCAGIENYSRYLTGRLPGSRRRPFSNTCRAIRWSSSTSATSPCRSWAACSAATGRARRRSPNTVSACPRAPTTGRSNSRNGTPIAARRSLSRRRQGAGRWSGSAASSSSRSCGRPASSTRPASSARPRTRSTI